MSSFKEMVALFIKMATFVFHLLITWFTISHTNYILTLVGNVHIFPSILKKVSKVIISKI